GKTWQNRTPPELTPWSKLAQIDASHFDTASAYAAVNRFRLDDLHPYIYRNHDGGKSWHKIVNGVAEDEPVNTVREDPERKGLLFAGTERTVYVSFDDGDHWQSLRLNLPATSIRDLVIHQDDVVIGTHGRSFWILDNITPLRQLEPESAGSDGHLFAPQLTYRLRRNNNTDTPLPPEEPAGKNPPDGAMLDYFLNSDAIGPVTLEILDDQDKLIRRFSSADKPEPVDDQNDGQREKLHSAAHRQNGPARKNFSRRSARAIRTGIKNCGRDASQLCRPAAGAWTAPAAWEAEGARRRSGIRREFTGAENRRTGGHRRRINLPEHASGTEPHASEHRPEYLA